MAVCVNAAAFDRVLVDAPEAAIAQANGGGPILAAAKR